MLTRFGDSHDSYTASCLPLHLRARVFAMGHVSAPKRMLEIFARSMTVSHLFWKQFDVVQLANTLGALPWPMQEDSSTTLLMTSEPFSTTPNGQP